MTSLPDGCYNSGMTEDSSICAGIRSRLLAMQDADYKAFHSRLMPTIQADSIIGVRTPLLRKFARSLARNETDGGIRTFMRDLPHRFYEENNVHAFLVEGIRNFDECVAALEEFLPFVDNWATCDMMAPKALAKDLPRLLEKITGWTADPHVYTRRFALGTLMRFFLDEAFAPGHLEIAVNTAPGEYYVDMMRAWFFATALAKQYEAAFSCLAQNRLDAWTHNKAIQKALESRRIPPERKAALRRLKRKDAPRTE